jgi:hypothetical protein
VYDPEQQLIQEATVKATLRKCVACAARDREIEAYRKNDRYDRHGIHTVIERLDHDH